MLHKLIFDTTNATSIADSHHVGAHTLSGAGDLITSGDGSADDVANTFEALDARSFLFGYDSVGDNWDRVLLTDGAINVALTSPLVIDVDLDGVYSGGNLDPDNVGMIAHVRNATPGDTQQTYRSTGASPTASDIDPTTIHALDVNSFMMAFDGTNYDRLTASNTPGALDVHVVNSVTVSDAALANTAIATNFNSLAVANTAEDVVAAPLAARKYLWVYNNDNQNIWVGATGVSATNGFPVPPGSYLTMRAGDAIDIEWVSSKVNHNIRHMELS